MTIIDPNLGELSVRVIAMPADTNPNGQIFGGWVLSQMDTAGTSVATTRSQSRVVTVSVDNTHFIAPVEVGDFVCCYSKLLKVGRTSMAIQVTTFALGRLSQIRRKVSEGIFTYVAVDHEGKPWPVDR